MEITGYQAELVRDPFGIIPGKRYEFRLDIAVEEDDELHSDNGLYVRAIYGVDEQRSGLVKYELFEKTTDRYLDFDLEDDEVAEVETYCREHLPELGN